MFSWLFISIFPAALAYLDYSDLGCHETDYTCIPYNPTYDHYKNKFDITYFFPIVLRRAIGSLSLPTQYKIISLKPQIKRYYLSGTANTAEDALGLIQSHILPNETSILRAGLLFNTLNMSRNVINKIRKLTNSILRAYYINDNQQSATVIMHVMMELNRKGKFSSEEKGDLMSQFVGFRDFMNEPRTKKFIRNYWKTPMRKRVGQFIEVLKQSSLIPNPRHA